MFLNRFCRTSVGWYPAERLKKLNWMPACAGMTTLLMILLRFVLLIPLALTLISFITQAEASGFLKTFWGTPGPSQLNLGMFTFHAASPSTPIQNNELVGLTYEGYTVTSLINSHMQQSYFVGITRRLWTHDGTSGVHYDAGYRFGLIQGYSQEWASETIGFETPILPLPQVFTSMNVDHMGIEFDLTGLVLLSVNFYVRI